MPTPFAPDDISGLVSWFAADALTGLSDGDPVGTWPDASGRAQDAVQATGADQPLYKTGIVNGLPVVRFSDTSDVLAVPTTGSHGATTIFAVVKFPSNTGDYPIFRHTATGGIEWRSQTPGVLNLDRRAVVTVFTGATTLSTAAFSLCTLASSNTADEHTQYLNGAVESTVTGGGDNPDSSGAYELGNEGTNGNFDFAEVIVYDSVLSLAERNAVTVYLGTKYGIPVHVDHDLTYTVHAFDPPLGLTPVVADNTDQSAALQSHLDYVKNVYGGGTVSIIRPGGVVRLDSGIVVPSRVRLVGSLDTLLDFTGMSTSGTAITVEDEAFAPLEALNLVGPESTGSPSGTSKGIDVTGVRLRFRDVKIKDFGRGWDWANSETWSVSLTGGEVERCGTGIYLDNVAASATNAGESMTLLDTTIFNCGRGIRVTGNGVELQMGIGCRIDFCAEFGYINDAWVYFTGVHMESQGGISGTYLFDVRGNAKVAFANCDIIMGEGSTGDLNFLFNPSEGPSNYGNGQAHFANTKIFCKDPEGGDVTQWSEQLITWPDDGTTTTLDMFTPYPLFWAPIAAEVVGQSFHNSQSTAVTCSSQSFNLSFGDLRLTSSPGSKFVRVRVG